MHEDAYERGAGNEIADYGGFALNEAGRLWALSYDPSRVTLRHHQCEGYVAPYQMRSTGNFRIWEERDPRTQRLIAIYVYGQTTEGLRTIWMDGRPHPPAWAPHTARGFSTGRFVGNALVVQTTHIKQGWVRRNGLPGSDQTTMTDFFLRNGDRITNVTVANDPVFFSEPQVRSNDYVRQPVDHGAWLYACDDGEQILDRAPDYVPHYLFGKQPFAREFAKKYNLPVAASLMGAASIYPELPAQLRTVNTDALFSPAPGRPSETSRAVPVEPRDGQVYVLPIRNSVYMLVGDGGNIVVQTGEQGPFVVDTGEGKLSDKVLAAIRTLTPKPIQFIANTNFHAEHTGGNDALGAAGQDPSLPGSFFVLSAPRGVTGFFSDPLAHATMLAHNNVMVRMQAAGATGVVDSRRHLPGRAPPQVAQRRRDRALSPAERQHRRRQPGPLPQRRRAGGRRHLRHHPVPAHRQQERRHGAGPHRCAEQHPEPHGVPSSGRRRHLRRAGPRLPQRRARGGGIPRHGGDRPRSRQGDERRPVPRCRRSRRPG